MTDNEFYDAYCAIVLDVLFEMSTADKKLVDNVVELTKEVQKSEGHAMYAFKRFKRIEEERNARGK